MPVQENNIGMVASSGHGNPFRRQGDSAMTDDEFRMQPGMSNNLNF